MPTDPTAKLPTTTPDQPLDVLVAGGGPCGTAVAFRASELRMSVLVLELDDLLKRIRDYGKEKQILPSHGGGADLRFPAGGEFIAQLEFEPIDKDDLCARWKGLYARNNVSFATGTQLTGLARTGELWTARVWSQQDRTEYQIHARHVVLAIGRGVPRRFDIPGNVEGIAFNLNDPEQYVGSPACVVGGGTSAAEAVIAISNAKAKADDASTVHWCYRGEKMPLVAQALAEAFFKAHLLNGNIRLQPNSDPSAIVIGADKSEYFAIRTDRRVIAGRPAESTHLEFPKRQCIACIGEDIPEAFLKSLGIAMVVGGAKARKQMVVSRLFESQLEHVYLGGALLSPNYLVADAMDGDPATFTEVDRRDNIKLGLYDGVTIAEVIRQRLDGVARQDIQVTVRESVRAPGANIAKDSGAPEVVTLADVDEAPSPGRLRRLGPDGVQVDEYRLKSSGVTTIGRKGCDIVLPEDTTLAEDHASISAGPDGCTLRDDGSSNGVYFRVPQARWVDLSTPSIVRAGRQFLRFVHDDNAHVMIHYDLHGNEVGRHTLPARAIVIGRGSPDIILDPADQSLSRRHIGVMLENATVRLMDLQSRNGTYLKLTNGVRLESGDEFRIGNQRFVVDLGVLSKNPGPVELGRKATNGGTPEELKPHTAPPSPNPLTSGEPKVTIQSTGKTITVKPGQSICEALEAAGIETRADCHAGACGSDPIQIIEGSENLNACGERESRALDTFCQLEPGPFRLSCVAKPTGPVVIEIVST